MNDRSSFVQFVDDDEGYLCWLNANPRGFVVNSNRVPTSSYLVLDRAACKHINNTARTNWTTTGYIKTCSEDWQALDTWAKVTTGGSATLCGSCKPAIKAEQISAATEFVTVEVPLTTAISRPQEDQWS